MKKNKKYKVLLIIAIFIANTFLLPNNRLVIKNVYAVEPGDRVEIPSPIEHPQHAIYEARYTSINWTRNTGQRKVYEEWIRQGYKTVDDGTGLCYITVGGVDWILVAVSDIFGLAGDYLKVHVSNNNGEEKNYYMIICDIKGIEKDSSRNYFVGNIHYGHAAYCGGWASHCSAAHGHSPTDRHLNILEFVWYRSTDTELLCQKYTNVEYIVNGGSYFDNPDGPVGFSMSDSEPDTESETFLGACGSFFREIWDSLATFMDNEISGTNKSTVLYTLATHTTNGWVWPTPGVSYGNRLFGMRLHPVDNVMKMHNGIDIPAPQGYTELAAKSGTVVTGADFGQGYNIWITADDTSLGTLQIVYMHCDPEFLVESGEHVYAGQPIAKVGPDHVTINGVYTWNGKMTGSHLHFEVRINGTPVDPLQYVQPTDTLEEI